jgi:hypothetical protein
MAFPGTYNFNYYQGDLYDFVLNPKQSDGNPFDLAGYSGLFTVATSRGDSSSVIGSSQTASVNSSLGTVTCRITPAFGATLTGNSYIYDVQIKNPSASAASAVFTLVTGTISVTRDITNTGSA